MVKCVSRRSNIEGKEAKVVTERVVINDFKRVKDDCFKNRDITFCNINGKSVFAIMSQWKDNFSEMIKKYEHRNNFNADETTLLSKCLTDSLVSFEHKKYHGKDIKEGVITLLTVNADETKTSTLLMINKSVIPQSFKNKIIPYCLWFQHKRLSYV